MDERISHATKYMASKRTNESSECTNGQHMNERTKPDNRTCEMPVSQTDTGKWTNGTNPSNLQPNKCLKYTYFFSPCLPRAPAAGRGGGWEGKKKGNDKHKKEFLRTLFEESNFYFTKYTRMQLLLAR